MEYKSQMCSHKRWAYAAWIALIVIFALFHLIHLRADFPSASPWIRDSAKYTDEGWYGNAAVAAHLTGNWQVKGDLNTAPAAPAWPFMEWLLYFFTGVTVEAARGLAVSLFLIDLLIIYVILRKQNPPWVVFLVCSLLVTNPFIYSFSRLAILEPLLVTLTLGSLYLAVRLPHSHSPLRLEVALGVIIELMILTKPTAVFLLPAIAWICLKPIWTNKPKLIQCILIVTGVPLVLYCLWLILIIHYGLFADYQYLFILNKTIAQKESYWLVISIFRSIYAGYQVDQILFPLFYLIVILVICSWRSSWVKELRRDPIFKASILLLAGYTVFFIIHREEVRYYFISEVFCILIVIKVTAALLRETGWANRIGWSSMVIVLAALGFNGTRTLYYVIRPQYSFVNMAEAVTHYIDSNPNGKRLLVSDSGDDITLISHLPALCDEYGTQNLSSKMEYYQPGWYAAWNYLDPRILGEIHRHFSIEEVASFNAFDREDRNQLVLFRLHPINSNRAPGQLTQNLNIPLPVDKIEIPVLTGESLHRERIRDYILMKLKNLFGQGKISE